MRSLFTVALSLTALALPARAQEEPSSFGSDSTVSEQPTQTESQQPDAETKADAWKPRFVITLHTIPGGANRTTERVIRRAVNELRYEKSVDDSGKTVMTPRKTLRYVDQKISVSEPGTAKLYCDTLTMTVSGTEDLPEFGLESKGRLTLHIRGMSIEAAAGTLKEGRLELTDATVTSGSVKFDSATMNVSLPIHGMQTETFNLPVPDLPMVLPARTVPQDTDSFRDDDESFTRGAFFLEERNAPQPKASDDGFIRSRIEPKPDDAFSGS